MRRAVRGSEGRRGVEIGRVWFVAVLAVLAVAVPGAAQLNQTQHRDGWILAAAHAPGLEGSIWRTDLWLVLGYVGSSTTLDLYFCPAGTDNTDVDPISVTLTPGNLVYYFEDVVDQFLGVGGGSWVGAIHYVANTPVQAWARVYSVDAAGTSSYGQAIEGIPTADMTPDDDPWDPDAQQWISAMKHTADGRYRVNVGIINPTAVPSTYFVNMYDEAGNLKDSQSGVNVPPFSMVQLLDPFASVNGGEWSKMQIRVACQTDGGGAFAYASVIDNATNDAFFIRGVKNMSPEEGP